MLIVPIDAIYEEGFTDFVMDRRAKPYHYLSAADIEDDPDIMEVPTDRTKDDVARFLISILCRTKGKDTLKNIADKKYQPLTCLGIHNRDELREFCREYPQCFILSKESSSTEPGASGARDEPEVEVTTSLKICPLHVKRAGSCPDDAECGCLHACKFFILSGRCEYSTKARCYCAFGHKLWNDHNHTVLKVNAAPVSLSHPVTFELTVNTAYFIHPSGKIKVILSM